MARPKKTKTEKAPDKYKRKKATPKTDSKNLSTKHVPEAIITYILSQKDEGRFTASAIHKGLTDGGLDVSPQSVRANLTKITKSALGEYVIVSSVTDKAKNSVLSYDFSKMIAMDMPAAEGVDYFIQKLTEKVPTSAAELKKRALEIIRSKDPDLKTLEDLINAMGKTHKSQSSAKPITDYTLKEGGTISITIRQQ